MIANVNKNRDLIIPNVNGLQKETCFKYLLHTSDSIASTRSIKYFFELFKSLARDM